MNVFIKVKSRLICDFSRGTRIMILLILAISNYSNKCMGQNHSFKRLSHIAGQLSGGDDWGHAVAYDDQKSIYTVGHFAGSADFDPGPSTFIMTTSQYPNIFVQKVDSIGSFEWAYQFGSGGWEYGRDVHVTADSCILITGNCSSTQDFDPGPSVVNGSQVSGNIFLLKLDRNGNFQWVKNFGGDSFEAGYKIATDSLGNIYMVGYTMSTTIDFDPSTNVNNFSTNGDRDIWITKLNSNGGHIWSKVYGGSGTDNAFGLCVNGEYVYLAGEFEGTVDFDPINSGNILTSNGDADAFVQKMDLNGNVIWTRSFGATSYDNAKDVRVNSNNDVLLVGTFRDSTDFDPSAADSLVYATYSDPFILKLDSLGDFLWVNSIESSTSSEEINAICLDINDNIYVTGGYKGYCTFDTPVGYSSIVGASSYSNLFYMKVDNFGNYLWTKSIAGNSNSTEEGMDIEIDEDFNLYLTGTFWSYADFDPGPDTVLNNTSANMGDVFTLILEQCYCEDSLTYVETCFDYEWIDGIQYVNDTISYYIVSSSTGCDSIVSLFLTINEINSSIVQIDDTTLSSVATGAIYQWLDCNDNYNPIAGENNQTFTATSNGEYALQVTGNGCTDTSSCVTINSVDNENQLFEPFAVFPNPTNSIVKITFMKTHPEVRLRLLDLNGRKVYSSINTNCHKLEFEIAEESGIYLLEVIVDDVRYVSQVVKR